MLVMLAYDLPETKHQTLMRVEFERLGDVRVQYSIYVFEGGAARVRPGDPLHAPGDLQLPTIRTQ